MEKETIRIHKKVTNLFWLKNHNWQAVTLTPKRYGKYTRLKILLPVNRHLFSTLPFCETFIMVNVLIHCVIFATVSIPILCVKCMPRTCIHVFAVFYICEMILLANSVKFKYMWIKDGWPYWYLVLYVENPQQRHLPNVWLWMRQEHWLWPWPLWTQTGQN